ncbi:GNAT family N-acetyltransferase [Deinococcus terrestris]|uniref:GNAT family N-acetyltransferase n=1 Tax=Deinococcus terrestris TaxID=2651870 RepID=UPI002AD4E2B0|nr:GNAT family N-acetyltransferase [Deinococcus terrestris]
MQEYGPHLRSGNSHRTAKLNDLYTVARVRRQGVGRALMQGVEAWARSRPLRYVFWYANQREAGLAYQAMGHQPAPSGQEGYDFYEIDLGDPALRQPHPLRGS